MALITEKQWQQYDAQGYLRLGKILSNDDLKTMQDRIDQIMLGKAALDYNRLFMQLDSDTGNYNDAGEQSFGFKRATLDYRKIQALEADSLFLAYMQRPIFKEICQHVYGINHPVASFRAMFMNKPANKGTFLPWHQDRWNYLDRDPLITLWTALDPATIANGCVQIIPGSHRVGLINPSHPSGFLSEEQAQKLCPPDKRVFVELEPGEVFLMHNYLLHGSDKNNSSVSRRAFSVCYMDGNTTSSNKSETFPIIFGKNALQPA